MHFDGSKERKGNSGRIPDSKKNTHRTYPRFQITIEPTISDRLDKYCEDEERAKSWVIQKSVDEWLKKKGY